MNKCCGKFPSEGFINRGQGKYLCNTCKTDVSKTVLEMFLKAPRETMALVIRKTKEVKS